ncbi:MAG: hypothetical protein GF398_04390 [Chitinivibrionales bacterium]|nr:hypothetical protein [Chitinivibrionales bacterium]
MNTTLPPIPELDYQVVINALKGYAAPRKALSDMLARGLLLRVKKGIYVQSGRGIDAFSREILSNMIYGPSYVSYESALSAHGMIPERVEMVISATIGKTRLFKTPIGTFSYIHQKPRYYAFGFNRLSLSENRGYLMAIAEKALADRVLREPGRFSLRDMEAFLFENLRVEPTDFRNLDAAVLSQIAKRGARRSLTVLERLRRSLA